MPPKELCLSYSVYGRNFEKTVLENYEYTPITFKDAYRGDMVSVSDLENEEKMKDSMKLTFYKGANLVKLRFPMKNVRAWSLDTPFLYEAQVTLTVDGKKVDTPPKEMELLFYLASSPNRVYTRNQLLDEVWGFDYFGDSRTVDVHVKRLREKLEGVSESWNLKTVWGVGYKFEVL
jgi:hypothetical protein